MLRGTFVIAGAALTLLTGCAEEDDVAIEHGVIKIEFQRAENEEESPYVGTTVIEVALTYQKCLIDFYTNNPNYRQSGPDGDLVFGSSDQGGEGWRDRLCDGGSVDCSVQSFEQQLGMSNFLKVTYAVEGDDIENREILWGPIPLPELANCEGNEVPQIRYNAASGSTVRGLSAGGNTVWELKTVDPNVAEVGQGQSIDVRAGKPD